MNIILNGKSVEVKSSTVGDLLKEKELHRHKVAIEVDGEIIPKSLLDNSPLKENSIIEIITFVGGG